MTCGSRVKGAISPNPETPQPIAMLFCGRAFMAGSPTTCAAAASNPVRTTAFSIDLGGAPEEAAEKVWRDDRAAPGQEKQLTREDEEHQLWEEAKRRRQEEEEEEEAESRRQKEEEEEEEQEAGSRRQEAGAESLAWRQRLEEQEKMERSRQKLRRKTQQDIDMRRRALDAFCKHHSFEHIHAARRSGSLVWTATTTYPLHVAAELADAHIVEMLLKEGVNPALKNSDGRTAAHVARRKNLKGSHAAVISLLGEAVAPRSGGA
eukprot:CAMPEP_0197899806 /NCGR_PEP_ID=MMETSP1439-20131203/47445_1 /TAXON_ID=66791 /ORGANISM="Gonyaulax spinifera, Strain CCMP409" /LENGTH=262 /DNA_ID=CAMNT_0043520635 /DNA_START=12 /DNA_END=800 /DNA_ORIENTATION=+